MLGERITAMSLPPCLPELHKLFPQLAFQLKCLNGEYRLQHLSHQSSASIVRCMRDLLSDPCHVLPEELVENQKIEDLPKPEHRLEGFQLKKGALDDVSSLVSESAFTCAPRFPGPRPSLITVEDKKSMILDADLYPCYNVPTIGFCFDVLDRRSDEFRDGDRVVTRDDATAKSKVGFVVRRISDKALQVKWDGENEEEVEIQQAMLQLLVKVRVHISKDPQKTKKDDSPMSEWCQVQVALTTNDQIPKQIFVPALGKDMSNYTLEANRDDSQLKAFIKDVDASVNHAKMTLLDQCHEYTILKGLARRLAESFCQLTRVSAERKVLQDLKVKHDKLVDREKEKQEKKDGTKDSQGKELEEVKKKWEEKQARHQHVNDGNILFFAPFFQSIHALVCSILEVEEFSPLWL